MPKGNGTGPKGQRPGKGLGPCGDQGKRGSQQKGRGQGPQKSGRGQRQKRGPAKDGDRRSGSFE